jgi:hypothetical protein
LSRLGVELVAGLLLVLGVAGWFAYHDHKLIKEGTQREVAREVEQSKKLQADADKRYAEALKARDAAEKRLTAYVASHPVSLSQLCKPNSPKAHLPQTSAGTNTPADVLQPVPPADNGESYDRPLLLEALAGLADSTSAAERH